jgi:oxalate decarboxylase/phosphoglucose isomerase-like protein (cupin superfamily)
MLKIEKGWGRELVWADTEKYCGKFLKFNKGGTFSMHFHADKDETWYVLEGKFILKTVNTENAEVTEQILNVDDTWRNIPLLPHQLICLEEGTIIEVSTKDDHGDNYRILPGDSQK